MGELPRFDRAPRRCELLGAAFDQHGLERLDADPVKRRGAVEEHRVVLDHFVQNIPYLDLAALHHSARTLDRMHKTFFS
jgi:hypothetical protein